LAATYKLLGQVRPSANTLTTAYTVPSATEAVISTIVVTNTGPAATTYRIAIRPNGASASIGQYVAYDISVPTLDAVALTLGITLDAADVISVESYNGLTNFHIFGSEIA